jgi:hypothetical protein
MELHFKNHNGVADKRELESLQHSTTAYCQPSKFSDDLADTRFFSKIRH